MNREEYMGELARLNAQPPKKDIPKQKFKRGQKVHVCKREARSMYIENDFNAIVQYTYAQKFHGDDTDSYSLIILNKNDDPINSVSWFKENQLTLIDSDTVKGKIIIDEYKYPEL